MRLIASHDQARYADRAADAAPLLAGEIEDNEQIARKERSLDRAQSPCVPHSLVPLRQKRPDPLVLEMRLSAQLAHRQGMHDIPPPELAKDGRMSQGWLAVSRPNLGWH